MSRAGALVAHSGEQRLLSFFERGQGTIKM
jgi:hypothetical protein